MTKIGTNIKKIRKTKGLSQQAFAELLDISRGNISSYEENRAEPKLDTIINIANYFGIPIESLLTKDLSINEILKYNADKLLEEEQKLGSLKLKEVPYINDDTYVKISHKELSCYDFNSFPLLKIPDTSNQQIIALKFNPAILHHEAFESFQSEDILFFRAIVPENIHLINQKLGMFTSEHTILLGQYETNSSKQYYFSLNTTVQEAVMPSPEPKFWKLFATYQSVK